MVMTLKSPNFQMVKVRNFIQSAKVDWIGASSLLNCCIQFFESIIMGGFCGFVWHLRLYLYKSFVLEGYA
jgi:hypothetical protein